MKNKKLLTLGLLAASSLLVSAITLSWDFNDPAEKVDAYNMYELQGNLNTTNYNDSLTLGTTFVITNKILVGTVPGSVNMLTLTNLPGMHVYAVTASNAIGGESPFSNLVRYYGPSGPQHLTIRR